MSYHKNAGLGMPMMATPPLGPPGGAPGFWTPPITASPGGSGGGAALRNQCEGYGGRYSENCRHMGPTLMPQPGAVPGLPHGGKLCQRYCDLPSGEQSAYHEPSGNWSPSLQSISGFGDNRADVKKNFINPIIVTGMIAMTAFLGYKAWQWSTGHGDKIPRNKAPRYVGGTR